MPQYDYLCVNCGRFTEVRPMNECASPQPCPECSALAPRAILKAPYMTSMSSERRTAFATNERSAHAPKSSAGHSPGCSCCSTKGRDAGKSANSTPAAAKSFPAARPWMISH